MAEEAWGTKRVCPTTGKRFYDLNKTPIVSPYTGEVVTLDTKAGRTMVADKADKDARKDDDTLIEEDVEIEEEDDAVDIDDDDVLDDDETDEVSLEEIGEVEGDDED